MAAVLPVVAEQAVMVAVDMAMEVVVTVVVESFECKLSTFHQLTPGL